MAIAFDAATDGSFGASPRTFSHTVTGSNPILFVFASVNTGVVPTATYNSVAMTEVNKILTGTSGSSRDHYLFVLMNPATGANNVSITASAGNVFGGAMSYTGAATTGQPDSSGTNFSTSATSLTGSTTVVGSNCWLVGLFQCDSGATSWTAGSGTTFRSRYGGFNQFGMFDSNGTVGTGSQSLIGNTNTTADKIQCVIASFAPPATAATVRHNFAMLGVGT